MKQASTSQSPGGVLQRRRTEPSRHAAEVERIRRANRRRLRRMRLTSA